MLSRKKFSGIKWKSGGQSRGSIGHVSAFIATSPRHAHTHLSYTSLLPSVMTVLDHEKWFSFYFNPECSRSRCKASAGDRWDDVVRKVVPLAKNVVITLLSLQLVVSSLLLLTVSCYQPNSTHWVQITDTESPLNTLWVVYCETVKGKWTSQIECPLGDLVLQKVLVWFWT